MKTLLKKPTHDHLLDEVAKLTGELERAQTATRQAEHRVTQAQKRLLVMENRLRATHTLNTGMFSMLDQSQIYRLACESLVYLMGWKAAFVISMHGQRTTIQASYQATQKQLTHLQDYLSQNHTFTEAYAQRQALSTYHNEDKHSLSLRTLFQADEVLAMPIQFGERLYGYCVVCGNHANVSTNTTDEVDFLASVGSQIAQAIQLGTNYQSLEEQNIKLRQLDELKNSFISITSHQLRTPLSIVKWILSILEADTRLKELPEQMKMIEQAYDSNERLIHVVNDLLNVSRIQDGRLPYNPQPTDPRSLLLDMHETAKKQGTKNNLEIRLDLPEHLPTLEMDPLLFKEALQNLLDNAVDYNSSGGHISIKAHQNNEDHILLIEIANSGPTIPKEDLKKIFDQFYRSPEAIRIQPNGNGLGLYLTRAIVKEHGGELSCSSEEGQDTVFSIRLPIPAN